jgi:hypothetical protein
MQFQIPATFAACLILSLRLNAFDPSGGSNTGQAPPSSFDNGAFLQSGEGLFTLRLNAFAQVRYTLNREFSQVRRQTLDVALGRASMAGSAYDPDLSYFVQVESSTVGDGNRAHLLDAWMQYQISPRLNVQAGRLMIPFSRQFYTHPGKLLFSDLSGADYAFNLPRSTGVHAWGKDRTNHLSRRRDE